MSRCDTNITYVREIVIMMGCPSITQGTRWFIGVIQTGSKGLLHLISGDCYVCHRPPHSLYVPIFSIRDQPEPADVFLNFGQSEIADLRA